MAKDGTGKTSVFVLLERKMFMRGVPILAMFALQVKWGGGKYATWLFDKFFVMRILSFR